PADAANPWRHTPAERLREDLANVKENAFRCIAVRDLKPYIDRQNLPADPLLNVRQPPRQPERLTLPAEVKATRADLRFWLEDMLVYHHYTWAEAARACGWSTNEVKRKAAELQITPETAPEKPAPGQIRVLPYPGTRETRRGV